MDEEFEDSKLETITTVVYALQVLTYYVIFLGFIGIIINYVKKSEVEGTWLESHFQ